MSCRLTENNDKLADLYLRRLLPTDALHGKETQKKTLLIGAVHCSIHLSHLTACVQS
jgi:hypothetical protein